MGIGLGGAALVNSHEVSSPDNRTKWWTQDLQALETAGQRMATAAYTFDAIGVAALTAGVIWTGVFMRKAIPACRWRSDPSRAVSAPSSLGGSDASTVFPRTLAAVVIAVSSLIATSCYAPDIRDFCIAVRGGDPCPSGMVCNFGLCVASDIAACGTGIGVWLTTDDYKALCPAIGPATFNSCSDNYEIDKTAPKKPARPAWIRSR